MPRKQGTTLSHDTSNAPDGLRVLVVGGGVAALETMLALRALAADRVDIELLARETHFWYRPLAVAEPFELGEAHHFEPAALAAARGAWFTPGKLAAVEPDLHLARTTNGVELTYDALVLALGARAEPFLDGALTFRGPADTEPFRLLLADAEAGKVRRLVFTFPAEAAWPLPAYELALLTASRSRVECVPARMDDDPALGKEPPDRFARRRSEWACSGWPRRARSTSTVS